ncbi:hypothetical protein [Plantactinospora sp. GCM10030261]|uniref:hypothetical protein n=1 Tax=Plantactinospora sp. GCM10030261 TaxID=3273420 RepID=UPI00361CD09B
MPSAKPLGLLLGAAPLAVVGTLFGSPWATGAGGIVVLGGLALHPAVTDPAVSRSTRLLLRGCLLLLALAGIVTLWGWVASPFDGTPADDGLTALVIDPGWRRTQFLRQLAVAGCLFLACVCLGVAIGRLPREGLRRFGRAAPTVGVCTLVAVMFIALLPTELTAMLGSVTSTVVAAGILLGGCAWVVRRAARRHGTAAPIAVVGATVLAVPAWLVIDHVLRSWPERRDNDDRYVTTFVVSGVVDAGADIDTAMAVAALLLGSALTVLACVRLGTADRETS